MQNKLGRPKTPGPRCRYLNCDRPAFAGGICKHCINGNSWQRARPSKRRAYKQAYRLAHPDKYKRQQREQNLKRKYGLTIEGYEQLYKSQEGKCAICNGTGAADVPLAVDHSHSTGKVRGLLCKDCNTGLGHFKDNEQWLSKAVHYLRGNTHEAN